MEQWSYYADGNQALLRFPAGEHTDRRGQRYWGRGDWSDYSPALRTDAFGQIDADEAAAVAAHIDTMPGGASRDRHRFWPDQAHRWTMDQARRRAAQLKAETGPDSDHWTVNEYFDDVHELRRLRGSSGRKDDLAATPSGGWGEPPLACIPGRITDGFAKGT